MTDNVYLKILVTDKVILDYNFITDKLFENIENSLKPKEGLCIDDGFIKPNSIKLLNYSSGELVSSRVRFTVIYECLIANAVDNMILECKVKSITKAGIRAELDEKFSPFVIFLSRDHHYNNDMFSTFKEEDKILVRVIGQRFELNDTFISIIGEINNIY
jgi:DNA-directed RNA polymerase subunit E'/Rpb7